MTISRIFVSLVFIASASAGLVSCGDTTLASGATDSLLNQTPAQIGPGGRPAGGPGGMMPGLPPNFEEIKTSYPEFAAALESMQNLSPEERATQMTTLFEAHPEWEALMPAPGAGGPGGAPPNGAGPNGGPPPGGPPPGGPPPGGANAPIPQPSASSSV